MKTLPTWVQREIRDGMNVQWFGRRASFEIVEEVSEAAFRLFILSGIWNVLYNSEWFSSESLLVTFIIVSLFACNHAIAEIMSWRNEIYVVTSDEVNGGGRIYRFSGWLNKSNINDPITSNSPTIISETTLFFRIWGKLTGEKMERVRLASINNTYIEGRKISPQFRYSIRDMGGYKAPTKDNHVAPLQAIRDISFAHQNGYIDERKARDMVEELLRKAVYQ